MIVAIGVGLGLVLIYSEFLSPGNFRSSWRDSFSDLNCFICLGVWEDVVLCPIYCGDDSPSYSDNSAGFMEDKAEARNVCTG